MTHYCTQAGFTDWRAANCRQWPRSRRYDPAGIHLSLSIASGPYRAEIFVFVPAVVVGTMRSRLGMLALEAERIGLVGAHTSTCSGEYHGQSIQLGSIALVFRS